MITIDFSVLVSAVIFLSMSLLLGAWVFSSKQKEKDLSLDGNYIWFCSVCTYTYVNTKDETISLCPRCGSYNKK